MNLLLDLLSRLFHRNLLQGKVMDQIVVFCSDRGIDLEFVEPNENVQLAMNWLADKNKPSLSLVHMFEQDLESSDGSPVLPCNLSSSLPGAPPPAKLAGVAIETLFANTLLHVPHLELDEFGSCSSPISEIRALTMQMADSFSNARCRTAAHLACGVGGFTIGATLAGFLPILSRDNADAAVLFHSYLTGGFSSRGDLALMGAVDVRQATRAA